MLRAVRSLTKIQLVHTSSSSSSSSSSNNNKRSSSTSSIRRMGTSTTVQRDHTLRTARGTLIGVEVRDSGSTSSRPIYRRYTRIRYALPPTGDRRWKKPEPLPFDWIFSDGNNRPRDYRSFGAICPQQSMGPIEAQKDGGGGSKTRPGEEVVCNLMDEDCLFLNIWVPVGGAEKPTGGWPVQFDFPGGGWLCGHGMQQSLLNPVDLFRESRDCPRIVVSANARVGIFGYLASGDLLDDGWNEATNLSESAGNFGLWDLRMALEWTHEHIHLFGGNPRNITAGGYGPMTAFQIHYDTYQPPDKRIIRRSYMFSGAVSVQPVDADSSKSCKQFDEICEQLMIDRNLPSKEKMRLLRGVSSDKLMEVTKILEPEFKPVTDGDGGFVPPWMMQSLWSGEFGRRLKQRGFKLVIGDPSEEKCLYDHWARCRYRQARIITGRDALLAKLKTLYPDDVCQLLVTRYANSIMDWASMYYEIIADVQCHAAVRGWAQCLYYGGMSTRDVLRYHIAWRPKGFDEYVDRSAGISHVMDAPIWWFSGWRAGFSKSDRQHVLNFAAPFGCFVKGDRSVVKWGPEAEYEVRLLGADGLVTNAEDPFWTKKLEVWRALRDVQSWRGTTREEHKKGAKSDVVVTEDYHSMLVP